METKLFAAMTTSYLPIEIDDNLMDGVRENPENKRRTADAFTTALALLIQSSRANNWYININFFNLLKYQF